MGARRTGIAAPRYVGGVAAGHADIDRVVRSRGSRMPSCRWTVGGTRRAVAKKAGTERRGKPHFATARCYDISVVINKYRNYGTMRHGTSRT